MSACELAPNDKKAFVRSVGNELVRKHGKRRYYKPEDIRRAAESGGYPIDIHCWAYCIFATPEDFRLLHEATGEACDYFAMRSEVLADLASGAGFSWLDVNLSWLEWPDIDLGGLFDWFDLPS